MPAPKNSVTSKGEYQYIDLGSQTLNASVTAAGPETSFSTARLGLNYRFGGGPQPLK